MNKNEINKQWIRDTWEKTKHELMTKQIHKKDKKQQIHGWTKGLVNQYYNMSAEICR